MGTFAKSEEPDEIPLSFSLVNNVEKVRLAIIYKAHLNHKSTWKKDPYKNAGVTFTRYPQAIVSGCGVGGGCTKDHAPRKVQYYVFSPLFPKKGGHNNLQGNILLNLI